MQIKSRFKCAGIFKNVEVLRSDGSVKSETGEFRNLITDAGIARFAQAGTGAPTYTLMKASSSTTQPTPGMVTLPGVLASNNSAPTTSDTSNYEEGYLEVTHTWTFSIGEVVGNVSTLATGWSAGQNDNFSVARILDAQGAPTTITILADEQLRVTWSLRIYPNLDDVVTTIENTGSEGGTYTCTLRPKGWGIPTDWRVPPAASTGFISAFDHVSSFSHSAGNIGARKQAVCSTSMELGPYDGRPSGTNAATLASGISISASAGDGTSSCSISLSSTGATTPIGGLLVSTFSPGFVMGFQIKFSPAIPKSSLNSLKLTWGITLSRVDS